MSGGRTITDVRSSRGLTLLELMVAMAIFSVVGTAIYSTFTTAVLTRDHATERARRYAETRTALDRLEQDLRGSFDAGLRGAFVPPRLRAPLPEDAPLGDDRLILEMTTISARGVLAPEAFVEHPELVDLSRLTIDRGDQAHVRWVLDDEGDLLRYELRPVRANEIDWTTAPFEVIARDVDISLEFYDQTQWTTFWDSSAAGSQKDLMPTLVRTRLTAADEGQAPVVLVSSAVIPMAIETATKGRNPLPRLRDNAGRDDGGNSPRRNRDGRSGDAS